MNSSDTIRVRDTHGKIVSCIQQGDLVEAEALARQVLRTHPRDPNILLVLGVTLMRQNEFEEALKHLSKSIENAPRVADGHEQYGLALASLGRFTEAEESLQIALKLDPNSKSVHAKLTRLQSMQGEDEESQKTRDHMFERNPHWQKLQDARKLQTDGKFDEARRIVKSVLRVDPIDVNALSSMAGICMAQDAFNDAEAFLRKALELAPDFGHAWSLLSLALKEQSKFEEAVKALEKACSIAPENADWHSNLGNLLLTWGKEERALDSFNKALAIDPSNVGALLSKGHVLKTMGDLDDAISAYRASAKARPDLGEIYWSLANLKTFRFDADEVEFMQTQIDSGKLTSESELHFCYSLGKHFEDQGNYPNAFEYYAQGGATKRKNVTFDPVEHTAQTDKVIEMFTPEFFKQRASFGHSDAAPILIVGLPRSGSTLIEQILSSHSQVDGTAELSDLMVLANQTGMNRFDKLKFPESLIDIDAGSIDDLG
jgi:tetratricopeptide (TPR) repeat protein